MAKTEESADKQVQLMNTEVHPINSNKRFLHQWYQPRNNPGVNPSKPEHCTNCGWGPHSREQCRAKNATCHYCQKFGHLAKVCLLKLRNKNVHEIEAANDNLNQSETPSALSFSWPDQRVSECLWSWMLESVLECVIADLPHRNVLWLYHDVHTAKSWPG